MRYLETLSKEELKKLCSKGGKATPKENRPFFKDRELARRAGKLGAKDSPNNFRNNRALARKAAARSNAVQGKYVEEDNS